MKSPNLVVFLLALLSILSCHKNIPNNNLVVHIVAEPDDMHPTNGASAIRAEIQLYTHMSLLRLNYKTGELIPCLAKNMPVVLDNGLKYQYILKEDATWDDGQTITATDIEFTAKASKCLLTNNPAVKSYWDNISKIECDAINKKMFTVIMKKPYILNTWFWTDFPIIQQNYYDENHTLQKYTFDQLCDSAFLKNKKDIALWAASFNDTKNYTDPSHISGAGPYKLSKWDKGVSMTLEKKENHWTKNYPNEPYCAANPDKIIFKVNTNNASTVLELKSKLVDVSTQMDFSSFLELSKDKKFTDNYVTKLCETYNYTYVCMNVKPDGLKHKNIFTDLAVRRSMAMLIPYDQINKTIYENKVKRITGPVSSSKNENNANLKLIEYNVARATKLLKDAGWVDTDNDDVLDKLIGHERVKLEFDLNFMNTQKQWEDIAKHMSESMQKAKIFVRLNPLDYSNFVNACLTHDFDMSIGAWQGSAQPEDFSQLWSTASWQNNGLNFSGFGNAASDGLIDSMNCCVNEQKHKILSMRFQQLVYNEQPYIFMFSQTRRVVVNKKWNNLQIFTEYPGVLLNTLSLNKQ